MNEGRGCLVQCRCTGDRICTSPSSSALAWAKAIAASSGFARALAAIQSGDRELLSRAQVTHSMGGLLTKHMLMDAARNQQRSIFPNTLGIVFYGSAIKHYCCISVYRCLQARRILVSSGISGCSARSIPRPMN